VILFYVLGRNEGTSEGVNVLGCLEIAQEDSSLAIL
jgi:hypothetical protein